MWRTGIWHLSYLYPIPRLRIDRAISFPENDEFCRTVMVIVRTGSGHAISLIGVTKEIFIICRKTRPVALKLRHKFSQPALQNLQAPLAEWIQAMPTRLSPPLSASVQPPLLRFVKQIVSLFSSPVPLLLSSAQSITPEQRRRQSQPLPPPLPR